MQTSACFWGQQHVWAFFHPQQQWTEAAEHTFLLSTQAFNEITVAYSAESFPEAVICIE